MRRILSLLLISLFALTTSAQWAQPDPDTPRYNDAAPVKTQKLPLIMSGAQLSGDSFQHPTQVVAYKMAAKVDKVIYQMPCYCHCDRHAGHTSLRDCFVSLHGANCSTCMQEAIYAYQMTKKGKTAKQIRADIMRGEYSKIDLQKTPSL